MLSFVERYHEPLSSAFRIIKIDSPGTDNEAILQFAVKSDNDSFGHDSFIPTLLVYGPLPRIKFPADPASLSLLNRFLAVRKAT